MPTTRDLAAAMQSIAPLELAESWDNVGLLAGSWSRPLAGPVILTIDLTPAVATEALALKASAIIAYHPPIFDPLTRLTDECGTKQAALLHVIQSGIAVYCPHTALDAAAGGVTDWLADGLMDRKGIIKADRRALSPDIRKRTTEELKIVTFVPADHEQRVRDGLASAGAGMVGNYTLCSFAMSGVGTFIGGEGSMPSVGVPGQLETVREVRLEMVCARRALALAVETLRQFHPYEEPSIDVYELVGQPRRALGAGRRLVLDQPATIEKLADRLKSHLGIEKVQVARGIPCSSRPSMTPHAPNEASVVGICPGAGSALVPLALAEGCEVFVTGEMKHHEVLAATGEGLSVILAGHTTTERGYLPNLAERLGELLPGIKVIFSREDRNPLVLL
ncbi:MAG: Nif3-like dinuclear metal center hexameric protein [Phycisphaerales bacterium]|nr:Nif3-like dinuclear metal center hexameric protein [Phycisphaerales bacterium]